MPLSVSTIKHVASCDVTQLFHSPPFSSGILPFNELYSRKLFNNGGKTETSYRPLDLCPNKATRNPN